MTTPSSTGALVVCLATAALPVAQSTVTLGPVRDNTLYEESTGALSNGSGAYLFVGRTGQNRIVRALVAFDVAAVLPSGATITRAELEFQVTRTGLMAIDVHRATRAWGEGTSVAVRGGGGGAPATTGDATWLHAFYPSVFWSSSGGDFVSAPSTTALLTATASSIVFASTPALVADVQSMLDARAGDFGWLLRGDETGSARRFESRESTPSLRPVLRVWFDPPRARAVPFGAGCAEPDGVPPALAASASPVLGTTLDLVVSAIPPGTQLGALVLGFGASFAPIDLSGIGMPGCTLYALATWSQSVPAPVGSWLLSMRVPDDAGLLGVNATAQAFTSSPPRTPLGLLATNGVALTLGR